MRLDGVEVKVSLDSDQTARAARALGLAAVTPWKIFFVEEVTAGLCSATPLLDQHVIVRARQKTKGKDDVTVKFRPGRRSQLTDPWLATTKNTEGDLASELKVEEDWAGERRVLSISLTSERPEGLVAAVATGERRVAALLTHDQRRLVDECAGLHKPCGPDDAAGCVGHALAHLRRAGTWWSRAGHPGRTLDCPRPGFPRAINRRRGPGGTGGPGGADRLRRGQGLQPTAGEAKTTQVLRRIVAEAAC